MTLHRLYTILHQHGDHPENALHKFLIARLLHGVILEPCELIDQVYGSVRGTVISCFVTWEIQYT